MMRGLKPGDYRQRVAIQRPVRTQDATTGEMLTTWETVTLGALSLASVPAECLTGPGAEAKKSGALQYEVDLRVSMRYLPGGFDPVWRLVWDGFAYDVRSVEYDSTGRREMRLACKNLREAVTIVNINDGFLLEDGGFMLLEDGGFMLQE